MYQPAEMGLLEIFTYKWHTSDASYCEATYATENLYVAFQGINPVSPAIICELYSTSFWVSRTLAYIFLRYKYVLTLTVLVKRIDALRHFETG